MAAFNKPNNNHPRTSLVDSTTPVEPIGQNFVDLSTQQCESLATANRLALGKTSLIAHGYGQNEPVVVTHNYVTGPREEGGSPVSIIPWPELDATASMRLISALRPGETALTLPTQPDLISYYREVGLHTGEEQILEVPFKHTTDSPPGFPDSDPLSLARSAPEQFAQDSLFVATFPSDLVRQYASELGYQAVQKGDASQLNNKALFREGAARYGYSVTPGYVVRSPEELLDAVTELRDAKRVWVKLDRGLGGDLVIPVDAPIYINKVQDTINCLKQSAALAFTRGNYGDDASERYWPQSNALPADGAIVLELDIGETCEVVENVSCIVVIKQDGSYDIGEFARQIVSESGTFIGGTLWQPDEHLLQAIDAEIAKVVRFNIEQLNHYGIFSLDMLIGSKNEVTLIEENGRISSNGVAGIIGAKAGASFWLNTKLAFPSNISTVADFEAAVTAKGHNYARPSYDGKPLILAQSLRSLWAKDSRGDKTLAYPSSVVEGLVCGQNLEECSAILQFLEAENGVKAG